MARRIAILVGNARFHAESGLEPLQGPPNDVAALGAVLEDADRGGFEVQRFVDARKDAVLPVIDEVLNTAEADDLVLLFYAGHGKLDPSGRLCLATAETRAAALRSTSIPVSELKELVAQSRAGSVVLLLDCCFSGAIGKEFMNRGDVDSQLSLMQEAQGLHILTAATGLQTARERDSEAGGKVMGAFTRVIVDGIGSGAADRDGDGEITLTDLRRHLAATIRGQTPKYLANDASGDPRIARARPPESKEQKRLRRLGQWYNDGKIPEPLYPAISDAAGGEGDRRLVELVQRILDNKEMRARQLVAAWEAAVNPQPSAEPPRRPAAADPPPRRTSPFAPPEPSDPSPASPLAGRARLKAPIGVFVGGIAVALFGVFAMFSENSDDYSVVVLLGMLMMVGGGIWGGVRLLGRAARSIGLR